MTAKGKAKFTGVFIGLGLALAALVVVFKKSPADLFGGPTLFDKKPADEPQS